MKFIHVLSLAAAAATIAVAATATVPPPPQQQQPIWRDPTADPMSRAKALVAEMTLDEKLSLFHGSCGGYTGNVCGIGRLGIPQQKNNDGPQGFRGTPGTSTSWPASLTVSAAFDTDLMEAWGKAMGQEFYGKGANIQLGPGLCLARVPRNGRNFEYVSGEDPFLGYHMSAAVTKGIQSEGVIATAKHYVNNNQETDRGAVIEVVDERTNFEMYYPPFEGSISAGLGAIMCSYNKICKDCTAATSAQGKWSCENPETLQTDLKERLGFKGWVMSDWGATHSTSMNAGLDQEMPGSNWMGDKLAAAVASGNVTKSRVDDGATRILWPFFAVGLMDKNNTNTKDSNVTSEAHNTLARTLSADGTVLLQNQGNLLPISLPSATKKTIAVIGLEAANPTVHGGGSGQVFPDFVVPPLDAIRARAGLPPRPPVLTNCSQGAHDYLEDTDFFNQDSQTEASASSIDECRDLCAKRGDCGAFTLWGGQCFMKADAKNRVHSKGRTSGTCVPLTPKPTTDCTSDGNHCVHFDDGSDPASAAKLAASADIALVFGATSSHEGSDRDSLHLDDKTEALISAVGAAAGKKTAVVAVTPGALLTPWRTTVAAVVTPMMPGQQYGNAIADVLFGDVNPAARLPVTFPAVENQVNFTNEMWPGTGNPQYSVYSEKLLVGYRWYAAHKSQPAYSFGHGLSYTTFGYSAIKCARDAVSVTVTNTGSVTGAEVAQLYLEFPAQAGEPPLQLKGFNKVILKPGASTTVTFPLNDRSFSIWDVSTHAWATVKGNFGVKVGASVDDIRQTGTISVSA